MKGIDHNRNGVDTPRHVDINKPFVCLPGSSSGMQVVGHRDLLMFLWEGKNINTDQIFKFIAWLSTKEITKYIKKYIFQIL